MHVLLEKFTSPVNQIFSPINYQNRTQYFISSNFSTFNIFPEYKPVNCEGNKAWPTVQDLRSEILLEAILNDLSIDVDMAMCYQD